MSELTSPDVKAAEVPHEVPLQQVPQQQQQLLPAAQHPPPLPVSSASHVAPPSLVSLTPPPPPLPPASEAPLALMAQHHPGPAPTSAVPEQQLPVPRLPPIQEAMPAPDAQGHERLDPQPSSALLTRLPSLFEPQPTVLEAIPPQHHQPVQSQGEEEGRSQAVGPDKAEQSHGDLSGASEAVSEEKGSSAGVAGAEKPVVPHEEAVTICREGEEVGEDQKPNNAPDLARVKQEVVENGEEAEHQSKFSEEQVLASVGERLTALELSACQVEQWLLFQRSRFDLKVFDEPFHGLQFLFNPSSGRYIRRVWGKTRGKGVVATLEELGDLLEKLFHRVVPCLGFFDFRDGFSMNREDLVAVEFPVPRVISKDCVFAYKLPEGDDPSPTVPELLGIGLCSMCMGVKGATAAGEGESEEVGKFEPLWGPQLEEEEEDYRERRRRRGVKKEEGESEEDPDYYYGMSGNWSDSSEDDDDEEEELDSEVEEDDWEIRGHRRKRGPGRPRKFNGGKRARRTIVRGADGRKRHRCGDCGKGFNQSRSLDKHRETHHLYGSFDCDHCGGEFRCSLANEFYVHVTSEHPSVEFKCLCCNEVSFPPGKETDFKLHYVECVRARERESRRDRRTGQPPNPNKKKPHQCDECGKTFAARTTFEEHKNWHKGLKPIKCPECDFATCFSTSLYTHSKIHMRQRGMDKMATNSEIPLVHICEICGNRYNQANQLRTHIKRIHEGVVEHRECTVCGAVFTNRQNLRRHVARSHPKDPSLQCKTCGHVCADRYAYQLHQRVHREPDFMCRFCGKAVKSKQTLQAHERSHTGENPYKCDSCDYACKSSSVLNRHKQAKHNLHPGPPKK